MSQAYTYEKQDDYGLLSENDYEVFIEKAEIKVLDSGKQKVAFQFRVRNDIEQSYKGRVLFEDIWKERDTEYFNRKRLNQLLGTQEFEDGQVFPTIHDLLDELCGRNLIVKVVIEFDEYHQKEVNKILYYKKSEHKPKSLDEKPKADTPVEDDLPF